MDYNFRGQYDPTKSYIKKDVVSYQPTVNDSMRFYFCLTDHTSASPQTPNLTSDSQFWGLLNTSSNFPNNVDSFLYRSTIQASDKADIERINVLTLKSNLNEAEQNELNTLTQKHRDKLLLSDDINAIQQSISNLQMFYKDKVDSKLNENVATINTSKDNALTAIEAKKNNVIEFMDSTTAGAIRNDIGVMGDLTTSDKGSLVKAINEINSKDVDLTPINNKIGDLVSLETISKDSTVSAINEIKQNIDVTNQSLATHKAEDAIHLATGTANAITINTGGNYSYGHFKQLKFKATANNIGNVTINVDGQGAKPALKFDGTQLATGAIKANKVYDWYYDTSSGGRFFLIAKASGNATAGDVLAGKTFSSDEGELIGALQPFLLTTGTIIIASLDAPLFTYSKVPAQVKQFSIKVGGQITVSFELKAGSIPETVNARLYKNSIAVGVLRTTGSDTFITYTEDIAVEKNDVLQVFAWSNTGNYYAMVQNFRIKIGNNIAL